MTLLNLEAEWVALSQSVKDVMLMIQFLGSMKISVKLTVMVRVDNVRARFMAHNITATSCYKHFDTRYQFMNQYVEDK